jgi:hypothetical protein
MKHHHDLSDPALEVQLQREVIRHMLKDNEAPGPSDEAHPVVEERESAEEYPVPDEDPEVVHPEPTAPEPAGPIIISLEDRLQMENLQLKHMSTAQELQVLQLQSESVRVREQAAAKAYRDFLAHLQNKYGFETHNSEMDAQTGLVRPRSPQMGPPGMMAHPGMQGRLGIPPLGR